MVSCLLRGRLPVSRVRLSSPLVCRNWWSESVSDGGWLKIGTTRVRLCQPNRKELVPQNYAYNISHCQSWLKHIQWMAQKDTLGQDMFLLGSPCSLPRRLALAYCELTGREMEYVSLSRDTTETDLKQRREIVAGTVHYVNQPAVESALEGRVLVLEGVEKAERNVLPVLNNLLENREMQLDDGRLIVAPERYDRLVEDHGGEMARQWNLLRASERFRVIAIGVPVPPYRGNPLDPPLRSRFQARSVQPPGYQELYDLLSAQYPLISTNNLSSLVQLVLTLQTVSTSHPGGPVDLTQQLHHILEVLSYLPEQNMVELLQKIYPADILGTRKTFTDTLEKFEVKETINSMNIQSIGPQNSQGKMEVEFYGTGTSKSNIFRNKSEGVSSLHVPCGTRAGVTEQKSSLTEDGDYIPTKVHEDILARLIQSHKTGDFCLVGEKGTGKETLVKRFASLLGYDIETVVLYQDMTSRELLQQRSTLPNGDTTWRTSPLVHAAREGKLVLLDGIHRLHPGTLSVIKRLLQDRELSLMDGSKLLSHDNYESTKTFAGLTDEDMAQRSIYPIHPSFRVVGLGEPPVKSTEGSSQSSWISPEPLTMFQFHQVPSLPVQQERHILENKVPNLPGATMDSLLNFTHTLRASSDPTLQSLSSLLSTRQLIRIARRLAEHPLDNFHHVVHKSCLSRFLPQLTRDALNKALEDGGILPPPSDSLPLPPIEYSHIGEYLSLGSTKTKVKGGHSAVAIVPDILFYDNQEHLRILEDMVKDYALGEHLLLVGNQGVGKNKIADRFLQLLKLPREYIQLHRDTTVQSLTLQPTVEGGVVKYQDSPLVRAVQLGRVLVVDEADKAPTNVTCILKNIIGRGDVTLADGRRIVHNSGDRCKDLAVIPVHPDFRMIALANRPGFPFLGNDFYAALGDMFSCHAVDNPDLDSELTMLRQYGRDVPEHLLQKLVAAFSELRAMADEGLIAYPYSTREVVAIVKHLQEFPHEGVSSVVRNVFDFDTHNSELLQVIVRVLHKHGIPAGASSSSVRLSPEYPLPALKKVAQWTVRTDDAVPLDVQHLPVALKGPSRGSPTDLDLEKVNVRGREFSELLSQWRIPLDTANFVASTSTGPGHSSGSESRILHVALVNPVAVMSMPVSASETTGYWLDLSSLFPITTGMWTPQLNLAPLPSGRMLLHEELSNSMFTVDAFEGCVYRVTTDSIARSMKDMLGWGHSSSQQGDSIMCTSKDGIVHLFNRGGTTLESYNLTGEVSVGSVVTLPFSLGSVHTMSENQLLLTEFESPRWYILDSPANNKAKLYEGVATGDLMPSQVTALCEGHTDETAQRNVFVANATVGVLNRLSHKQGLEMNVHVVPLEQSVEGVVVQSGSQPVVFPQSGEIALPTVRDREPGVTLVDLARQTIREILLPWSESGSAKSSSYPQLHLSVVSDSELAAVDQRGTVRILETGRASLERSLTEWQALVGQEPEGPLCMQYERESGQDVSSPKHGKIDPENAPHVGGNTWAGGTGGRDTAGLGGKGGPYRLDAGHDIHQIPDWEKEAVPEEVKKAAREMGQKAKREKLREIGMSEHDNEMYQTMLGKVQRQIKTLRVMLANIQSQSSEREWIRHQTTGDLDERKLIEGLAGEKAIYKRRGEKEPEVGADHVYPKRIRLVVDVSGSMYRFNSYDGRLERSLEAVLVVMEAFDKQPNFRLDIVGHSGDSFEVPFVQSSNPPANDKERLQILKAMIAESQYCWSGDNTMEATRTAIQQITKDPADEYFVIVFSDANFSRYGIRPSQFASLMNSDPRVNVFAIFIGSLGDQAKRLRDALPSGRSLICMNNKDLPQQLQRILLSTIK